MKQTPTYLAIDIETTGLSPVTDHLIEIAVLVLGADLTELAHATHIVDVDPDEVIAAMSPYVRDMHTRNGLIADIRAGGGTPLAAIDQQFEGLCGAFPARPILCGSSVHFDRRFIERDLPTLHKRLSHQHLDATTAILLAPQIRTEYSSEHRALTDIRASAAVLRSARALMGANTPATKAKR